MKGELSQSLAGHCIFFSHSHMSSPTVFLYSVEEDGGKVGILIKVWAWR